MQSVVLSLFINILMAALLLTTMLYCRRLSARIRVLQDSKSDLARIIREFDESTKRATQSIAEIHEATSRLSDNIQHKIDKANYLADDLQYMIEKGSKLAGKPETVVPPSRAAAASAPARPVREPLGGTGLAALAGKRAATPEAAGEAPAKSGRVRSRAEQELRQVLGGNSDDN